MTTQTPMCPFCLLFVDEQQPIGEDFWGEAAQIGGIPSCGDCASIIFDTTAAAHVAELARQHGSEPYWTALQRLREGRTS